MELKPIIKMFIHSSHMLLIVPYGIETCCMVLDFVLFNLLIVPYGIET